MLLPVITILAVIAAVLWWKKQHPYVVTREQMRLAMERVLEQKMPANEWSRLISKRIPRDTYLEHIRIKLAGLYLIVRAEGDVALYSPADTQWVAELLDELRKRRS
jgi:hypothetical protein